MFAFLTFILCLGYVFSFLVPRGCHGNQAVQKENVILSRRNKRDGSYPGFEPGTSTTF